MKLLAVRAVVLGTALGVAWQTTAQPFSEYDYEPGRVYPVRTALGITTQIELGADETVLDYSTGFSNGWDLTRRDNVFYLRPRNVDVDTNMVVRTDRRSYVLELKVVASDWTALEQAKKAGVQYKVTFRYPGQPPTMASAPPPHTGFSAALERDRAYHYDYDYKARRSAAWLVPSVVYDDGKFTYVHLAERSDTPTGGFPVVFARERERGEDLVLNTTVQGGLIVIHGVYPYLVIRHGKNVVGLRRGQRQ
jgi:type IV secretion system protein VirB9